MKKQVQVGTASIGACVVNRQSERESSSLHSAQEKSEDISAVLTPSCLACQEGQDQDKRSRNTLIMMCHCSHMVHEAKAGGHRRKGRPGGEAPESQVQSASGPAHGSGQSQRQEVAQAKMKALQHIEVPSSSSTSSSRNTKAQGKQQSQPQRVPTPPMLETSDDMATDQSHTQEDMSLPIQ